MKNKLILYCFFINLFFSLLEAQHSNRIIDISVSNNREYYVTSSKEGKIGYFKIELIKAVAPFFFGNKKKISCILSAASILKIILPEEQVNKKIFYSLEDLINALYKKKWIIFYILKSVNLT